MLNQNAAHLPQENALLKAFVETMPARVFWKDRESRYLGCNTQFASDAGSADSDKIIGKSDFDLCWKDQAKFYRANDLEVMETGRPLLNHVEQQQAPDGRLIWLETSKVPLYDERHQVVGLLGTYQDITERKENEDRLFKEQEMHRAMCDSAHFSIIVTDERGVVYLFNVGAERMLGYSAAEAIGQLAPEVIGQHILEGACDPQTGETIFIELSAKPADAATLLGIETLALKTRHRTDKLCILNYLRKDGSIVPSQVSVSTLHDAQWRTIGYLLIGSDASARHTIDQERERYALTLKQINMELANAKLAAEQANDAKSAFLAAMSHEIRTPMNGVVGMIDVLQQSSLSRHQFEMVDIMRDSAMALLSIIDDVLDFSKIEAGKLQIECLPIEVVDVVEKTHRIMLSLAEKKGVALTWCVDPAIPDILMGDSGRLRQILVNLIHNAIKFSGGRPQPGRVSVRAVLEHHRSMQATVAFHVQDNGIGMDAATRTQLFSAFMQADVSTTRRFGGTGLGLAISAQLTRMMGGDIEVLSESGQGSEFRACIPFAVPDAATRVRPRAADEDQAAILAPHASLSSPAARPREDCLILVAEDNAMNQEVIRQQLSLLGYDADIADDGQAALDRWRHGRYALLLTDLHMPDMDGYALTAAIRHAEDAGAHLPIVALTANALKSERQRCLEANMDAYLTKPVRLAQLQAILERWLPIAAPPDPPVTLSEPGDGPRATLDPTVLPSLIGENPARLATFRQHYRRCAHQLAEELRTALARGDWTGVGARAHQLKSASRAVGALALGEICDQLEQAGSAGDGEATQSLALEFETNLAAVLSALPENGDERVLLSNP